MVKKHVSTQISKESFKSTLRQQNGFCQEKYDKIEKKRPFEKLNKPVKPCSCNLFEDTKICL